MLGTILSERMKISKHKKRAMYNQYDWNFHKMIGYMLHLDSSIKDNKKLDACSEHKFSRELYTSTK